MGRRGGGLTPGSGGDPGSEKPPPLKDPAAVKASLDAFKSETMDNKGGAVDKAITKVAAEIDETTGKLADLTFGFQADLADELVLTLKTTGKKVPDWSDAEGIRHGKSGHVLYFPATLEELATWTAGNDPDNMPPGFDGEVIP